MVARSIGSEGSGFGVEETGGTGVGGTGVGGTGPGFGSQDHNMQIVSYRYKIEQLRIKQGRWQSMSAGPLMYCGQTSKNSWSAVQLYVSQAWSMLQFKIK